MFSSSLSNLWPWKHNSVSSSIGLNPVWAAELFLLVVCLTKILACFSDLQPHCDIIFIQCSSQFWLVPKTRCTMISFTECGLSLWSLVLYLVHVNQEYGRFTDVTLWTLCCYVLNHCSVFSSWTFFGPPCPPWTGFGVLGVWFVKGGHL